MCIFLNNGMYYQTIKYFLWVAFDAFAHITFKHTAFINCVIAQFPIVPGNNTNAKNGITILYLIPKINLCLNSRPLIFF